MINDRLVNIYVKEISAGETPVVAMHLTLEATRDFGNVKTNNFKYRPQYNTLGCKFDDDKYSYSTLERGKFAAKKHYFTIGCTPWLVREDVNPQLIFLYDTCSKVIKRTGITM